MSTFKDFISWKNFPLKEKSFSFWGNLRVKSCEQTSSGWMRLLNKVIYLVVLDCPAKNHESILVCLMKGVIVNNANNNNCYRKV